MFNSTARRFLSAVFSFGYVWFSPFDFENIYFD